MNANRAMLKLWSAPLAILQNELSEGEIAIASDLAAFVKRPDGQPTAPLIIVNSPAPPYANTLPVAINNTLVVASQAAMLAWRAAKIGDIAVRTDVSKNFILRVNNPAVLANWQELVQVSGVLSVNGKTGALTNFSEVGHVHAMGDITNLRSTSVAGHTVGNLPATYDPVAGTLTQLEADNNVSWNGVMRTNGSLPLNYRILVKDQDNLAENGIYFCSTQATATVPSVLTRLPEGNTSVELAGMSVLVTGYSSGYENYIIDFAATSNVGTTPKRVIRGGDKVRDVVLRRQSVAAASLVDIKGTYTDGDRPTFVPDEVGALNFDNFNVGLALNVRVLLRMQRNQNENGVYYVSTVATPTTPMTLSRTNDALKLDDFNEGSVVFVRGGYHYQGKHFQAFTISGSIKFKEIKDDGGLAPATAHIVCDRATTEALPAYTVDYTRGNDVAIPFENDILTAVNPGNLVIEGNTVVENTLILVKDEVGANKKLNGIYIVVSNGAPLTSGGPTRNFKLVRSHLDTQYAATKTAAMDKRRRSTLLAAVLSGSQNGGKFFISDFKSNSSDVHAVSWYAVLTSNTQASDSSIKTNIEPLEVDHTTISEFQPKTFHNTDTHRDEIGFVAQDLEVIDPRFVTNIGGGKLAVNDRALIAVLYGIVADLTKRVQELEKK